MLVRERVFHHRHPVAWALILTGSLIFLLGALFAFVISVDRIDELANGWRYQNTWSPAGGGVLDNILGLPGALYTSIFHFPFASLATVIFFPILLLFMPIYEVMVMGDYTFILMGWVPCAIGALIFTLGAAFVVCMKTEETPNPFLE